MWRIDRVLSILIGFYWVFTGFSWLFFISNSANRWSVSSLAHPGCGGGITVRVLLPPPAAIVRVPVICAFHRIRHFSLSLSLSLSLFLSLSHTHTLILTRTRTLSSGAGERMKEHEIIDNRKKPFERNIRKSDHHHPLLKTTGRPQISRPNPHGHWSSPPARFVPRTRTFLSPSLMHTSLSPLKLGKKNRYQRNWSRSLRSSNCF